ncbi:YesL family protein [Lederbergia graminis]|uniref:YesL family protein n=1 Tax=Lederbergia graminis TaxID=735518 RepID=A0ABW0LMA2_9BACI|nr:DUF624 domain-containing protein [Paenibacillus bovis]HLU20865.1 DUF624 domain-containing protein [Bacillaceae bacterium]
MITIINSRFYSALEVVSFFFILNITWLIVSLPIITIFPATAAMHGVIRNWVIHKDTSVIRPFFRFFKENFKHSFIIGLLFAIVSFIFYVDFMFIMTMNSMMQMVLLSILLLLGIIGTLTSIYLFPVMVHYHLPLKGILKNSFFFSIRYLPTTILTIIFIGIMLVLLYIMPVLTLVIFSIIAYPIFTMCYSKFRKEEELVNKHSEQDENLVNNHTQQEV